MFLLIKIKGYIIKSASLVLKGKGAGTVCKINPIHFIKELHNVIKLEARDKYFVVMSDQNQIFVLHIRDEEITNCTTYDWSLLNCLECDINFTLSTNHDFCFLKIQNCTNLDKNLGTCSNCSSLTAKTQNGQKCVPKINDCLQYDDAGKCKKCDQNLYISHTKEKCVQLIPSCTVYDDTGECLKCQNGVSPISNNRSHQCLDIYSIVTSNNDFKERHLLTLRPIGNERFVCSWLENNQDQSLSLKALIITINYNIFIFTNGIDDDHSVFNVPDFNQGFTLKSSKLLEGRTSRVPIHPTPLLGTLRPRNDIVVPKFPDNTFVKKNYKNIFLPMQISKFDENSFLGIWAFYERPLYRLFVTHISLDQSASGSYDVPLGMLYNDFLFNGYMHKITRTSQGHLAIINGLYIDFFGNFSIFCTFYFRNKTISNWHLKLFTFEHYNLSQPLLSVEELNNDRLAICYLTQNSNGNYINLRIIQFIKHYNSFRNLRSHVIGPFDSNSIKHIQLIERKNYTELILFWQTNVVYCQKFNIQWKKIGRQEEILTLNLDLKRSASLDFMALSVISVAILADDRWILVCGSLLLSGNSKILFKIEGDRKTHVIETGGGYYPTVACSEELNMLDNTSSFVISWAKNSQKLTTFIMKIFISKFIPYCLEYDDTLQKCTSCNRTKSIESDYCWKKIKFCMDYNNANGLCKACSSNLLLVDKNGTLINGEDQEGFECVAKIDQCQQYNLNNEKRRCLICSTSFVFIESLRKCVLLPENLWDMPLKIMLPIIITLISILIY